MTKTRKNTKEKLDLCENHLFILKENGKKGVERVILNPK
jgi:ribosomal protein L33